ncbi:MAG: hypothetical protein AAGF96_11300 [Bacteroidota bacterium]
MDIRKVLVEQITKFDEIGLSISYFTTNITWQKLHKINQQLPLIDFDIIYSGLSSFSSIDCILNFDSFRKGIASPNKPGSSSIHFLLSRMQHYHLPIGTQNELINRKRYIAKKVGKRAQDFQNTLRESKNQSNPILYIQNKYDSSDVHKIITEEFEELNISMKDFDYLDRVLENNLDLNNIISVDSNFDNTKTFKKALNYLETERPLKESSNLNDALNISTIPLIFNKDLRVEKNVPVFITQTDRIFKAGGLFDDINQFQVFNKYYYLYFSQMMLEYLENDLDLCFIFSKHLYQDIETLKGAIMSLLQELEADSDGDIDNLPRHSEIVEYEYSKFFDTWNWLFHPFIYNTNLDGIEKINNLNFDYSLINKTDEDTKLIDEAIHIIQKKLYDENEFTSIVFSSRIESKFESLGAIIKSQVISRDKDNGLPFTEIISKNEIGEISNLDYETRAFLGFSFNILNGSFLSIDLERKKERYYCFSWPHYCDKKTIIEALFDFHQTMMPKIHSKHTIELINQRGDTKNTIKESFMKKELGSKDWYLDDCIYLKISYEDFVMYCDLEPNIEDIEMQAGIRITKSDLANNYKSLSKLICFSTMISSTPGGDFSELMANVILFIIKNTYNEEE